MWAVFRLLRATILFGRIFASYLVQMALVRLLGRERLKERWPLGHLARVLGTRRGELVRLPRTKTLLLDLDGARPELSVAQLLAEGRTG